VKRFQHSRRPPKRITLKKSGRFAILTAQDIANLTGIALRTARAYRAEPHRMPAWIRELLEVKALGIVPGLPDVFIQDGQLHLPDGLSFSPERLASLRYVYQELNELRRQVKRERQKNARLHDHLDRYRAKLGEPRAVNDSE